MKRILNSLILALVFIGLGVQPSPAAPLSPGEVYTVEVYPITSSGQLGSRSSSVQATATADGKLTFELTNLPNYPDYNFLLVLTKDANNEIVRQAIAPAPPAGENTLIGISPASVSQTQAMLKAMEDARSDDPVMVLFGFTLIRTGALSDEDVATMGELARIAVLEGFNAYLQEKIGATKMRAFRAAVQNKLGGYTSKIKELIDSDIVEVKRNLRGEAGAMLSRFLVEAATQADFDPAHIPPSMKAMSDRAEMLVSGLSEEMTACMDVVMASTYLKIMAEVMKQKYSAGLTVLGASASQTARMNEAINNFSDLLVRIFQFYETLFEDEETMPTVAALEEKLSAIQEDFMSSFNSFMDQSQSSVEELDEMLAAIKTGICPSTENQAACEASIEALKGPDPDYLGLGGFFQVRDLSATVRRWPIPMAVAVKWVVDNYPTQFHYTRDDLAPAPQHWLNERHSFAGPFMPSALAHILELREDIEIVYGRRMAGEIAASCDITQAAWDLLPDEDKTDPEIVAMLDGSHPLGKVLRKVATENTAEEDDLDGLNPALVPGFNHCQDMAPFLNGYEIQGLEELLLERLDTLKENIGPMAVTEAQRQALIDVLSAPRFR